MVWPPQSPDLLKELGWDYNETEDAEKDLVKEKTMSHSC